MYLKSRILTLAISGAIALCATGPARADTLSSTAGPIPLSPIPLNLCVGEICAKTPTLGNVKLTVEVTTQQLLGILPRIRPVACPPGQVGAALMVIADLQDVTVSGALTGNIGSLQFRRPIQEFHLPTKRNTVISACTF